MRASTAPRATAPYRVHETRLPERVAELQLAQLVTDVYLDPGATVLRAAMEASHLVTTVDDAAATTGFLLVQIHRLTRGRGAAHVRLHGVRASDRASGITPELFDALDEIFEPRKIGLAWTVTGHPLVARSWRRHFGRREIIPTAPAHGELGRALWGRLHVRQSPDPTVARRAFPYEYAAAELALIARINEALPGPCADLDADAGDRRLLVAIR